MIRFAESVFTAKEGPERERQASHGVAPSRDGGWWKVEGAAKPRLISHLVFVFIVKSGVAGDCPVTRSHLWMRLLLWFENKRCRPTTRSIA